MTNFIMRKKLLVSFTIIISILPSCNGPVPSSSPLILQSPSYSPLVTPEINRVHFALDAPLLKGVKHISGQGPAGVRLQVVDVTEGGEIIGSGIISSDNKFKIDLANPLEPGRMICIELATPREPDTWPILWELRGENARAIPQMGYYFDCAVVEFHTTSVP